MKAFGTATVLLLWSVIGSCLMTEITEWRRARLERDRKGQWVAWLCVNGSIARLR
jgi:hypothetical protein